MPIWLHSYGAKLHPKGAQRPDAATTAVVTGFYVALGLSASENRTLSHTHAAHAKLRRVRTRHNRDSEDKPSKNIHGTYGRAMHYNGIYGNLKTPIRPVCIKLSQVSFPTNWGEIQQNG